MFLVMVANPDPSDGSGCDESTSSTQGRSFDHSTYGRGGSLRLTRRHMDDSPTQSSGSVNLNATQDDPLLPLASTHSTTSPIST